MSVIDDSSNNHGYDSVIIARQNTAGGQSVKLNYSSFMVTLLWNQRWMQFSLFDIICRLTIYFSSHDDVFLVQPRVFMYNHVFIRWPRELFTSILVLLAGCCRLYIVKMQ